MFGWIVCVAQEQCNAMQHNANKHRLIQVVAQMSWLAMANHGRDRTLHSRVISCKCTQAELPPPQDWHPPPAKPSPNIPKSSNSNIPSDGPSSNSCRSQQLKQSHCNLTHTLSHPQLSQSTHCHNPRQLLPLPHPFLSFP